MSTTFVVQLLNVLRERSALRKKSHAIIFFDLTAAFYRAQRHDVVANMLDMPDYCEDEKKVSTLSSSPALHRLGASPHLQAWAHQALTLTWSKIHGEVDGPQGDCAMRSTRGTRPGDPSADLLFTAVMEGIISQVCIDIGSFLTKVSPDQTEGVPPLVWVDDVAIHLEADHPCELLKRIRATAHAMNQRCLERGMNLNLSPGKTEAIIRIQGRGAHEAHRILQQEERENHLAFGADEQQGFLSLACAYTHLGQKQTAALNLTSEITSRLAHAQQALGDCRRLLMHKSMPVECRLQLARSLVMSKLLYASETWHHIDAKLLAKVEAFVMKLYRIILNRSNRRESWHVQDQQIWAMLDTPSALDLIRCARLRHFAKIVNVQPPFLLQMLQEQWAVAQEIGRAHV